MFKKLLMVVAALALATPLYTQEKGIEKQNGKLLPAQKVDYRDNDKPVADLVCVLKHQGNLSVCFFPIHP